MIVAPVMISFVLLLMAILGHTTLWISLVNRLHGRPWPEARLRALRHVHDAFVLGFPPILILGAGLLGPRLLLDGSWSAVGWFWGPLLVVCWAGFVWLLYVSGRHLWTPSPRQLLVESQHGVDVAAELGERPTADGPYFFMTKLPFNGQFDVSISQKTLHVPRFPRTLDGLTLWHISDWHFSGTLRREFYERVVLEMQRCPADLLMFTGDLIDNMKCVEWLPATLGRLKAPLGMFYILGNHDWHQESDVIRQRLTEFGWHDLAGRTIRHSLRDTEIALAGDETPWMGTAPDFADVPVDMFRLLLSHTPDNLQRARRQRVDLMLSGHTHGGQVQLPLVGPVYAPSLYGCKYASGTFFESPTLLHVSRGLAGIHPLRWRCPPEITRLTLRVDR